jgi:hypothetical protein
LALKAWAAPSTADPDFRVLLALEFCPRPADVKGSLKQHISAARRQARSTDMIDCAIVIASSDSSNVCAGCGKPANSHKGPRIVSADSAEPLCRDCARIHAPNLIALLDLAQTADQVGRHSRHLLTPSMKSLLELARAAETFAVNSLMPRVRAG